MQFKFDIMRKKPSGTLLSIWVVLLLFASFSAGFVIAVKLISPAGGSYSFTMLPAGGTFGYFDQKLYGEVLGLLKQNYVDKNGLDDKKLFYGALEGLVAAVGDPYTTFFSPKAHQDFDEELKGSFDGIGAELGIKNKHLTVISPLADSPAEKAGIRAGDIVTEIDGKDTGDLTLDQAVSMIRGTAGSTVKLTVFRENNGDHSLSFDIKRDKIVLPTVKLTYKEDIAQISIYSFNSEAEKQFVSALRQLQSTQVRGLIVDVRNNPGGFLDEAVQIASAWITKGEVVVREVYQTDRSAQEFTATNQVQAPKVPTVMLVNEGSASASEILAGALQDYGIATILGATTYGKGSVQELKSLPDGSGLKITVSQWLTPNGRVINNHGIDPDILVPITSDDYSAGRDPQLERAIEFIKSKISI